MCRGGVLVWASAVALGALEVVLEVVEVALGVDRGKPTDKR
jgi:hypothetical protein